MVTQAGLVVVLAILVLTIAVAVLVAARRGGALGLVQQQLEALRTQVGQALGGQAELLGQEIGRLTAQLNERLRESGELVQRSQTSVGERLDHTARVVGDVQRGLGELREATARVYDVGRDVVSLHDILRAPKLRGGLGELLLGDLLAQVLPARHFTLQHTFQNGERVDAVVRLGPALVPVDAKFPLEDFRRLLEAGDDETRTRARRAFVARVRKHIDDIATKYILPDEGTYDFALMYVPAEAIYYELTCGKTGALLRYAHDKRVFPVSPTTFTSQLQVIALGLKGLQIEQHAQEVMAYVADLQRDFDRFKGDFELVGKHLGNAHTKYVEAEKRLDRFEGKLERASEQDTVELEGEPAEYQPALDAA